jgi:hypothetical protein
MSWGAGRVDGARQRDCKQSTVVLRAHSPKQRRLLNCIVRAAGDVNKIIRCQQKYTP